MSNYPSGTVTFLFTDIEGSTKLWQEHPDQMKANLTRHLEQILSDRIHHSPMIFTCTRSLLFELDIVTML